MFVVPGIIRTCRMYLLPVQNEKSSHNECYVKEEFFMLSFKQPSLPPSLTNQKYSETLKHRIKDTCAPFTSIYRFKNK